MEYYQKFLEMENSKDTSNLRMKSCKNLFIHHLNKTDNIENFPINSINHINEERSKKPISNYLLSSIDHNNSSSPYFFDYIKANKENYFNSSIYKKITNLNVEKLKNNCSNIIKSIHGNYRRVNNPLNEIKQPLIIEQPIKDNSPLYKNKIYKTISTSDSTRNYFINTHRIFHKKNHNKNNFKKGNKNNIINPCSELTFRPDPKPYITKRKDTQLEIKNQRKNYGRDRFISTPEIYLYDTEDEKRQIREEINRNKEGYLKNGITRVADMLRNLNFNDSRYEHVLIKNKYADLF